MLSFFARANLMSFSQRIKNGFYSFIGFFRKHPILATALIAFIIAATVFTGGAILAAPVLAGALGIFGGVVGACLTVGLCLLIHETGSDNFRKSGWGAFVVLGGIVGSFAICSAIISNPIAGLVFAGIGLVSGFTAICAGIGKWISSCFKSKATYSSVSIKPEPPTGSSSPKIGHSHLHIPGGLSPNANETLEANPSSPSLTSCKPAPLAASEVITQHPPISENTSPSFR